MTSSDSLIGSRFYIAAITSFLMLTILFFPARGLSQAGADHLNADKSGLLIQGYDPVSYVDGRVQEGRQDITHTLKGVTVRFSSENNRKRFADNPDQYLPAYGGWCAWAMLEGDKVKIDPKTYKVIDGRVYLFYNGFWGDTLKKWNSLADEKGEPVLVEQADGQWSKLSP